MLKQGPVTQALLKTTKAAVMRLFSVYVLVVLHFSCESPKKTISFLHFFLIAQIRHMMYIVFTLTLLQV